MGNSTRIRSGRRLAVRASISRKSWFSAIRWLERGVSQRGERRVTWNGRDAGGLRAASGVYFVTRQSARERVSERVVLLK